MRCLSDRLGIVLGVIGVGGMCSSVTTGALWGTFTCTGAGARGSGALLVKSGGRATAEFAVVSWEAP